MKIFNIFNDGFQRKIDPRARHVYLQGNVVVIRVLQGLGLLPLEESQDGTLEFSWKSKITLYSLAVLGVSTLCSLLIIRERGFQNNDFDMAEADHLINVCTMLLSIFYGIGIASFMDRHKIVAYFKEWKQFQDNFRSTTGKNLVMDFKKRQWLQFLASVFMSFVCCGYTHHIFMTMSLKYNIVYQCVGSQYFQIVYFTLVLQGFWSIWAHSMYSLQVTSDQFLNCLQTMDGSRSAIRRYRQLWWQLRSLTLATASAFSNTLLYYYSCLLCVSVLCWYTALMIDTGSSSFANFAVAIGNTILVFALSEAGHVTTEKVSTKIIEELGRLAIVQRYAQQEKEIERFKNAIVLHSVTISLNGYVTFDRRLNIKVYSSVYSTLIVLAQFKQTTTNCVEPEKSEISNTSTLFPS